MPARTFPVNNNSNVRHITTKIVSYEISRTVVLCPRASRQGLTLASEKHHEIRNAPVIDVAVRFPQPPFHFRGYAEKFLTISSCTSFCKSTPKAR